MTGDKKTQGRQQRLSAQLRANLMRRKAQARKRRGQEEKAQRKSRPLPGKPSQVNDSS